MNAADGGRRHKQDAALMGGYGLASLVLIGLYPFLPMLWRAVDALAAFVGAAACIGYGRRAVTPGRRQTWTLLLWALGVFVAANLVLLVPSGRAVTAGRLIDGVGYVLLLAAALALIIRRGGSDLGGVIDAAVIALAAGSVLWVLLPHRLGPNDSLAAQVDLFTVLFALTGVLGALLRLATTAEPGSALWWLLTALGLVIGGNVVLSLAGDSSAVYAGGIMLLTAALTALGLFGLDPASPRLTHPRPESRERLSAARLVFLAVALAATPVAIGTRELLAGGAVGLLLAIQGALVSALVMARIGLLSAQCTRAEQALAHQATHDPLTHLPNRRQFLTQLRSELDRTGQCVLLFCDLDGFKAINDKFGHDVGDSLLVEVASRLQACVHPPHVVSRFGGDEFAVLLVDTTRDRAEAVRACIASALRRPFEQAGGATVGVSIGLAAADSERSPDRLIRVADHAMYQEKAAHASERSTAG